MLWAGRVVDSARLHINAACLTFSGGIGDHLFLSTLAHELEKRGAKNVFIVSEYGQLFENNPDVSLVPVPGPGALGGWPA